MKKSLFLLFVCILGCNGSSQQDSEPVLRETDMPDVVANEKVEPVIFEVPRPNSGRFSTEEATALMPEAFQRSAAIQKSDPIVTNWKAPTQSIRIHLTADETVEIVDFFGMEQVGVDSIDAAIASTCTDGNASSVLLTSETEGWDSPTKKAIIEILFQPSVQIYLVGKSDR